MRRVLLVVAAFVGSSVLAQAACVSDENASPQNDGGAPFDGAIAQTPFDSAPSTEDSGPDTSTEDSSVPDADDSSTPEASADANDATEANDAAPAVVVLLASSTNVTAEESITLTVTLNGVTATSIEIDDGATAIATLTTSPYQQSVPLTFLENGTHTYTAKATLASSQVVASAPTAVVVNIPANGYFIDPVAGSDTANTGTQASPFKTIAKGASLLASDGQSLYFAPGTYDSTTQTTMQFTFTHVTNVRGLAAGVILTGIAAQGNGNTFVFKVGGQARNVSIHTQYGGIVAEDGPFNATNVTFDGVDDAIYIEGTSVATIDETGVATPVTNVPGEGLGAIVTADGSAVVTFIGAGGSWDAAGAAIDAFFVRGSGTLTVSDFTVSNTGDAAIYLYDNGHLTLNDVSIASCGRSNLGDGYGAILMGGENTAMPLTSSLTINGGGITHSPSHAIALQLIETTPPQTPTVTFTGTHIDSSAEEGLYVYGAAPSDDGLTTITATNTTFDSNGGVAISATRASLTMTGGSVSNNTGAGIQITDATVVNTLKIRGTAFASNGADSIDFNGTVASTLDLGKTGDPGGLVFTVVPASFEAVSLQTAIAGTAVGNTWMANQQGANASGQYTTATTLTSATAAGTNAKVVAGGSLVVE